MKIHLRFLSAALLASGSLATAQNLVAAAQAVDPFVRNNNPVAGVEAEDEEADLPAYVSLCYESFSLPLADAATLRREGLPDAALYAELVKRTEAGTVTQEQFAMLCARSGEKAMMETISEQIYPTEFIHRNKPDPVPAPKDGEKTGGQPTTTPAPIPKPESQAPALPSSFETRNTGFTLEIEPTIGGSGKIIDLRFAPDTVHLVDRSKFGQGSSETEMPVFESQRVMTALTLHTGIPMMVGTLSRPPASKLDADSAKKVWFTFITAKIIKVPR
ncbi:hypothetical protein [Luteolibacter luteus]|uniref:Uncharacterized protein n=1 Tax=Luteolibacter luteus TaxID=2728835 RepID=A0A858RL23_9BACT|nr:hypothetical protein [Luteolibacter luteus]QJE97194.1 hypothetical protein HHL09_15835 [Luteolibacter luteus]